MQSFTTPRLCALAAVLSGAALSAQVNPFVFYPQDPERQALTCTSFVGRPDVANAAEALVPLDPQHVRGVGDANGPVRLFGMYHWLADERLSTIETWDMVVRREAATGGPDMSTAGQLLRINGLTSPPSTNPNRGTWIVSDGFNLSGGLLVVGGPPFGAPGRIYCGIALPANPLWPATDGHSLFRADMIGANTSATLGDNERAGAPHPTWAGRIGQPSFTTPWTYVLGPFVTSPNLHVGGLDPLSTRLGATGASFAMNGLYPDIGGAPRRDGLVVRVTDTIAPYALIGLGANFGFQAPTYTFPLIGLLHVDGGPAGAILLAAGGLQAGVREWTIALPNTIPPSFVGTELAFQALLWDLNSNVAEFTNAHACHL